MTEDLTNRFFNINELPAEPGILVFPISMSKIANAQSATRCYEFMLNFSPDKISESNVGLNIVYSDLLYLNSKESADTLKWSFQE